MTNFIELVIPIDRPWLAMLDTIALPITQLLPPETPYFFTNEQGSILRFRIEESPFENHKDEIYSMLLQQLQSAEKVKIYKQSYVLEEARFGKSKNIDVHTNLFFACSKIMVQLLEEAENIDSYESRMPYAVIAIHYILKTLSIEEVDKVTQLYMQHWMHFNEQKTLKDLTQTYTDLYHEEVDALRNVLSGMEDNASLKELFSNWKSACVQFVASLRDSEILAGLEKRHSTYFYSDNQLSEPRKWEVIADHIHLLLNRFGIQNEDETLLVYLTQSAMK